MSQLKFFGEGLPYIEAYDYPGVLITIEGTDGVGRTTQTVMLREWLEVQGFGVIETGWTRSQLIGRTISQAKQGRMLNRLTYSLLYAADFADRLEKEIIPALRSGFVVLADRYIYTALARDVARGVDRQWVRDLFGFAPVPHLVLYLKIDPVSLIRRVIPRGLIDYFESGMDMGQGDDPYDCFKRYQTTLIREYNGMADEFGFHAVSAKWRPERIHLRLREIVTEFFNQRRMFDWNRAASVETPADSLAPKNPPSSSMSPPAPSLPPFTARAVGE